MVKVSAIEVAAHGVALVGCVLAWRSTRVAEGRRWAIGGALALAGGVGLALMAPHAGVAVSGVAVTAMLALGLLALLAPLVGRASPGEGRRASRAAGGAKRGPLDAGRAVAAFGAAPGATVLACLALARWLPVADPIRLLIAEVLVFPLGAVAILLVVAAPRRSMAWWGCGAVALASGGALL